MAALVVAGAGLGLANLAITGSAHADPGWETGGHGGGAVAGVGSDTLQDLGDAFTGADPFPPANNAVYYTPLHAGALGLSAQVSSFDAIPAGGSASAPGCITTQINGPAFDRPNGSSNGITALLDTQTATPGWQASTASCTNLVGPNFVNVQNQIQFARSSRGPATAGTTLTFIPIGRDGVSYAIMGPDAASADFTSTELTTIYTSAAMSQTHNGHTVQACITQSGSGTTKFWEGAVAATATQVATATTGCGPGGAGIEENGGNSFLTAAQAYCTAQSDTGCLTHDVIIDFSAGSWISQANGVANDRTASARAAGIDLGAIDALGKPYSGTPPNEIPSPTFYASTTYGRDIYVVVLSSVIAHSGAALTHDPRLKQLFADAGFSVSDGVTNTTTTITSATAGFLTTGEDSGGGGYGPRMVTAPSRTVNDVTSNGTTTITSPTADFQSDDVGSTVTSTNLGLTGTVHIASVTNATTAVLDATPANTLTGTGNLTINTPLLPAGDFIASVTNGTTAVLNAASAHAGTTAGVNFVFASIPGAVCTTSGQNAQATRQKFGFDTPVLSCGSTSLTGAT